jgi:hypothetical protein
LFPRGRNLINLSSSFTDRITLDDRDPFEVGGQLRPAGLRAEPRALVARFSTRAIFDVVMPLGDWNRVDALTLGI